MIPALFTGVDAAKFCVRFIKQSVHRGGVGDVAFDGDGKAGGLAAGPVPRMRITAQKSIEDTHKGGVASVIVCISEPDGICMMTNYERKFLGIPGLTPMMEEPTAALPPAGHGAHSFTSPGFRPKPATSALLSTRRHCTR